MGCVSFWAIFTRTHPVTLLVNQVDDPVIALATEKGIFKRL
jgi:hypothetical protein